MVMLPKELHLQKVLLLIVLAKCYIMTIRYAKETDIEQIIALCEEHALYERSKFEKENKKEMLFKYLFGPKKILQCIVIEQKQRLLGYATFIKQFSTWDASFYIYLDCLFLKEEIRGKRIGNTIMGVIKEYALSEQCKTIQWQTPDFNKQAHRFYNKLGAKSKSKERFFWIF